MNLIQQFLVGFCPDEERESAILVRLQNFIARSGEAAPNREIVAGIGHITASAAIFAPESRLLLVFGRQINAWKLPGAHCDLAPDQTACAEAARALNFVPTTPNPVLWALGEREIAEGWQTPAHLHFELIFRFIESETTELPRGAKWFSPQEIAELGDETLARLAAKQRCQP